MRAAPVSRLTCHFGGQSLEALRPKRFHPFGIELSRQLSMLHGYLALHFSSGGKRDLDGSIVIPTKAHSLLGRTAADDQLHARQPPSSRSWRTERGVKSS